MDNIFVKPVTLSISFLRGVVVEWISHRTVDQKVSGSSPAAALMSFGKIVSYPSNSKTATSNCMRKKIEVSPILPDGPPLIGIVHIFLAEDDWRAIRAGIQRAQDQVRRGLTGDVTI